jgi:flavin reductase (DIM6/NTAB) family NADH-FMN oxidoreductase RutF
MTSNSFSTVLLEPALMQLNIRKVSLSHIAFTQSGGYMINGLACHQ